MSKRRAAGYLSACLAVLALTGCGGGGEGDDLVAKAPVVEKLIRDWEYDNSDVADHLYPGESLIVLCKRVDEMGRRFDCKSGTRYYPETARGMESLTGWGVSYDVTCSRNPGYPDRRLPVCKFYRD